MKLRLMFAATLAVLATLAAVAAPKLPQFSAGDDEHWYYVVFSAGEAVLADQGAGNSVMTRIADSTKEAQQWKLVGNADDFVIMSRQGNYAFCPDRVRTTSDASQAASFRLVASACQSMGDSWEIEYPAKGDEWNRWNQWGNTGPGVNVGLYTPGEANNALWFLPVEELPKVPVLEKIKEFSVKGAEGYRPADRHTLWYTKPATAETVSDPWMEYALPIGNGEFGAMVFGGIAQERVQFNDKSLWTGSSTVRGCYQNFGDLYIEDISGVFGNTADKSVANYVRTLDLSSAKAGVNYLSPDGNVEYTREYIASNPDKVVAIRLTASKPGLVSVRLRLFNGVKLGMLAATYSDGEASFGGLLDLVNFRVKVKAVAKGGTTVTNSDNIEVKDADEVLVILSGATNFDQHSPTYISDKDAMERMVDDRAVSAASKGWEAILADHTADFKEYFSRADFRIDAAENDRESDKMVTRYNTRRVSRTEPCNLMLEELYYAYGRYLLISSSRGMDTPANLQGIWNHSNSPAWQCDIHSNINVQMNYWPAEPTNLSEMHMPYLNYIHSMATEHQEWQEYARRSGQTKGWTCFTQNNIFGHSDYAENYVIANAWYCSHLWQHYAYTLDRDFLREKALPVMLSCAEFWMERLVEDADGKLVAPKEWSPEHGPSEEDGTAHAQQILFNLFKTTLAAISELGDEAGVDAPVVEELTTTFAKLDPGLAVETYTGAWGETKNGISSGDPILREWKTSSYSVGENEHRHQSHLMAMYPFSEITPESEWFEAAVNSLKLRGDLSTGWSLAWRLSLWARALDGEHAHKIITSALRHATTYGQSSGGGGIYYNLFDSHAPFQIDGNFGYTAGVTEMLLQSHGGVIRLLPSLSPYWTAGHIYGIRGEGNFEIDQEWKEGKLTEATVRSGSGKECRLVYEGVADAKITDATGSEVAFERIDDNTIAFPTIAGGEYTIAMGGGAGVESLVVASPRIRFANNVATIDDPRGSLAAYSLDGRLVAASATPSLDLSGFSSTALLLKGTTPAGVTHLKVVLK